MHLSFACIQPSAVMSGKTLNSRHWHVIDTVTHTYIIPYYIYTRSTLTGNWITRHITVKLETNLTNVITFFAADNTLSINGDDSA